MRNQSCVTILITDNTHCSSGDDCPWTTAWRDNSATFWTQEGFRKYNICAYFPLQFPHIVFLAGFNVFYHPSYIPYLRSSSPLGALVPVCVLHSASPSEPSEPRSWCPSLHGDGHLVKELWGGHDATLVGLPPQRVGNVSPAPSRLKTLWIKNKSKHLILRLWSCTVQCYLRCPKQWCRKLAAC